MNWNSRRRVAARGQRHQDRIIAKQIKIGCRPLAVLAAAAIATGLLVPGTIGEAQAQRVLSISGAKRIDVGRRRDRQDRGHPHRRAVHRHYDRRFRGRGCHPVDRPIAVDTRQEDRNNAGIDLRRGQEAGRNLRRRGVLRHLAALRGVAPDDRQRHQGVVGQRPHHALGLGARCSDPGQGGGHRPPVRARCHQRRAGSAPQQVMLEVRFIEATRQAGRALGIQWNTFGQNTLTNVGNAGAGPGAARHTRRVHQPPRASSAPRTSRPAADLADRAPACWHAAVRLPVRPDTGRLTVDVAVNALEEKGLIRSLAEPNLVALSGDTASFLAGGEFPILVPQSLGTVSIDYKKYGVGLAFTPTVLRDGADQSQDRAGSQRARPEPSGADRGLQHPAADRAPRLDHDRAARRPELRARRSLAEQEHQRAGAAALDRRCAGARRAVPQRRLQEERDRSRHHRHAAPGAADAAGRRRSRRRSTTRCRQTTSTFS